MAWAAWRTITPDPTTTVGDFRRFPGCRVLIVCTGCGLSKGYDPEGVIDRLRKLRAGGYPTPLAAVAARIKRRCPCCGEGAWRAQFAWPASVSEQDVKRLATIDRQRRRELIG